MIKIFVFIAILGAIWVVGTYIGTKLALKWTSRPDPELEEARRIMYEITVHDDMLPSIPQHLRDRIDKQLEE